MNFILTVLLGAIFSCDSMPVGQFMISRPIFCGPVIGYICGDLDTGIRIGIIIELLWIAVIPMGVSVPPDSTVVTIISSYTASVAGLNNPEPFIAFIILAAIPTGLLFKKADIIQRSMNVYLLHRLEESLKDDDFGAVSKILWVSSFLFFLKAAVFLAVFLLLAQYMLIPFFELLPLRATQAFGTLYFFMPALGLGTAVSTFFFKKTKGSGGF